MSVTYGAGGSTRHLTVDRVTRIKHDLALGPLAMPITNVAQIHRFTSMYAASMPASLREQLYRVRDDEAAVVALGVEWASDQCWRLLTEGAPGIHFYMLNRSHSSQRVFENIYVSGALPSQA